jgi:hypothetical protein
MHRTRPAVAVLAVLLALAVAACSGGGEPTVAALPAGVLPEDFPTDFPLPPDAHVTSRGDSVVMTVDSSPEEVSEFLARWLPATGWETVEEWEGVDPQGAPTSGWLIEKGEDNGVVAVVATGDATVVHVNLAQPYWNPQRGMGLYRQ